MTWLVLTAVTISGLVGIALLALRLGPSLLLRSHQAAEASVDQAPLAHALLAELAPAARIACPRLFVIPAQEPNGLAVATRQQGFVAVTEGVFDRLDGPQLRGVLAILVAALARPRARIETAVAVLALVFAPFVLPSVAIVRLGLRGDRWYQVDSSAATLVGSNMIADTLEKLESERGERSDFAGQTTAGLFCIKLGMPRGWGNRTLSTQPSTDIRVARLRNVADPPRLTITEPFESLASRKITQASRIPERSPSSSAGVKSTASNDQ